MRRSRSSPRRRRSRTLTNMRSTRRSSSRRWRTWWGRRNRRRRRLMAKGVDEVIRAKEGMADEKGKRVIERAIVAAGEVQKRAGQANVTEDVVDEASFFEPIFFAKLGKNVETIEESLDYIKN